MAAEIAADTLRQWLEEGRPVRILDVRSADQRAEWTIPGSQHADIYEALKTGDDAALETIPLPRDIPVVTVCAMGRTSRKAADILERKGIEAYSLAGGMKSWSLSWNVAEIPMSAPGSVLLQIRRAGKGCLSYLLGAAGEAIVIDPALPPEVYARLAIGRGLRITAVVDTHIHADHFSRSPALAEQSGARAGIQSDGAELQVGPLILKALRTPGHTPESTCYVVDGQAAFTGDTLFLDSVGRPDLLEGLDPREQAAVLYRSLRRLIALPEGTLILPAHHPTPPPFDGVPIAASLGELLGRNTYLQVPEGEFIAKVLAGTNAPPPNFGTIVAANRTGVLPEGDWPALEAGPNRCARA